MKSNENETKEREYMPFFRSFYEAINGLGDEKEQLVLYKAIVGYGLDGNEPKGLDGIALAMWTLMRPNIANSRKQFENGLKGGAPKGNSNARKKRVETDDSEDLSLKNKKPINVDDKNRPKRFVPPTIEDVSKYVSSNSYQVDPARFVDYYTARGWKIGNSPMKDWKAAVRTWNNRSNGQEKSVPQDVKLGVGEFIDASGRRSYGTGRATIPKDAPPRPSERHQWSAESNSWIIL